jgi:hypothetical protein
MFVKSIVGSSRLISIHAADLSTAEKGKYSIGREVLGKGCGGTGQPVENLSRDHRRVLPNVPAKRRSVWGFFGGAVLGIFA